MRRIKENKKQNNVGAGPVSAQRGITLIALVITIIVMIILAGVTINLTLGENGIFTTAQQAAKNYTDAQNKELAELTDFTDALSAGKVVRTEDGVQYVGDGVGNLIPVPVGFSYLEGTKATGFVIKNDTDGNEFVWVPVEGMSYTYDRVAWTRVDWSYSQRTNGEDETTQSTKITIGGTFDYIEKMLEEEKSVAIYGGFYIGRYEAGIKNGTLGSTTTDGTKWIGDNIKLVVQKDQQVWNYITRDKAKTIAEDLYSEDTDNVISKLCSSYAWDTALKFIETQNSTYPTNSQGGYYEKSEITTTGYDTTHPCNIYDMGGNASEWTTESTNKTNYPFTIRGGHRGEDALKEPAAYRGIAQTFIANRYVSFRVTLYI